MEKNLIKDQKYLTGLLTGFILAAIVMIGFNRYEEASISNEEGLLNEDGTSEIVSDSGDLKDRIKANVTEIQNKGIGSNSGTVNKGVTYDDLVGISSANPEAPHSPELQRLDIVLREVGRMIERMEKDIAEINETQIATVNQ
ncbi:hypothetical protein KKH36_03290 [Patescibacteria group bacterium]|nr:hypothetical protein [Patescibacteria group bacterium]